MELAYQGELPACKNFSQGENERVQEAMSSHWGSCRPQQHTQKILLYILINWAAIQVHLGPRERQHLCSELYNTDITLTDLHMQKNVKQQAFPLNWPTACSGCRVIPCFGSVTKWASCDYHLGTTLLKAGSLSVIGKLAARVKRINCII